MGLKELRNSFVCLQKKAYKEGIDITDFNELIQMRDIVMNNYPYNDETARNLHKDLDVLINKIYKTGLVKAFSPRCVDYIKKNSDILPLVYNNSIPGSEIFFNGKNTFQFDRVPGGDENNDYILVYDLENRFRCTGIEAWGDAVSYLTHFEHVGAKNMNAGQALELLCHIYGYSIPFCHDNIEQMAQSYRDAIVSETYCEMIEAAERRLLKAGFNEFYDKPVHETYEKKHEMIKRIIQGVPDPNFKYEEPPKKIILTPNRGNYGGKK